MPTGWPGGPQTPVSSLTSTGDEGQVLTVQADGTVAPEDAAGGGGAVTVLFSPANTLVSTSSGTFIYAQIPAEHRTGKTRLTLYLAVARGTGAYDMNITLRSISAAGVATDVETKAVTGSITGFGTVPITVEFAVPDTTTYAGHVFNFKYVAAASSTYLYCQTAVLQ